MLIELNSQSIKYNYNLNFYINILSYLILIYKCKKLIIKSMEKKF